MVDGEMPVVRARDLTRHYQVSQGFLRGNRVLKALDGANFSLMPGRTLAVVGESGCGKSTLARLVTMIEPPTGGQLWIGEDDIGAADRETLQSLRRTVQIVFQDPFGSLNPRKQVGDILEEPLLINTRLSAARRREEAGAMLDRVGLRPEHIDRYPHMFSGGQRQRIAIARALMLKPRVVVADEPVSALDVSIQAQVLNLLMELQEEFNLSYLFISHGLSVVEHISDEVMVMYLGKTVEQGARNHLFASPRHPYTQALLASTPFVDPARRARRIVLRGELPSPLDPPPGCVFHGRCAHANERCRGEIPLLKTVGDGHHVACHAVEEGRV
jgi:dipeptide transport system ATP-binding protein